MRQFAVVVMFSLSFASVGVALAARRGRPMRQHDFSKATPVLPRIDSTSVDSGVVADSDLGPMIERLARAAWGSKESSQRELALDPGRIVKTSARSDLVSTLLSHVRGIARGLWVRTGAPGDALELIVVDEFGAVVPRPGTH